LAEFNLPGGFEKLAAMDRERFASVREEILDEAANVYTAVRYLEVGKPVPAPRVIRTSESSDVRRFIDHWFLPNGRHYLWAGPREPAAGRRIELYDIESGKLVWRIPNPTVPYDGAPNCMLSPDMQTLWVSEGSPTVYQFDLTRPDSPQTRQTEVLSVSADSRWAIIQPAAPSMWGDRPALSRGPDRPPWVEFPESTGPIRTADRYLFSPDGRHLAWGTQAGSVMLIDIPALEAEVAEFDAEVRGGG
jgi:hypothetical protein